MQLKIERPDHQTSSDSHDDNESQVLARWRAYFKWPFVSTSWDMAQRELERDLLVLES